MCCMLIYARPIIAIRELFAVDNYPFLKSFFSDIQKIDTFSIEFRNYSSEGHDLCDYDKYVGINRVRKFGEIFAYRT